MRFLRIAPSCCLLTLVVAPACGSDVVEGVGTGTGTGTDTEGGSAGSTSTSTTSTTTTSSGTTAGSASATSGTTTGPTTATAGGSTTTGVGSTTSGAGSTTSGAGSTTSGAGSTTSGAGSTTTGAASTTGAGSTTGGVQTCQGFHEIVLTAEDASLSGDWKLVMSQQGEGKIARIPLSVWNPEGEVAWQVEVPCDDTWHIFVRGYDWQDEDSYFAQVDGAPNPEAIMELDCTGDPQNGNGVYRWREMNWRAQGEDVCNYVEDPWTFDWAAGSSHDVVFSFRESRALARIVVTNDPNWQP